ncbi:MAG: hypothetical protein MUO39_09755 [Steroidobacteraceae bacterium]|nr:hypothetical protein [Steroidobacteraceae bacterium]
MGNLRAWWQKLMGKSAEVPAPPSPAPRSAPESGGLELADEPDRTEHGRVGTAGFDPYTSDAGYAKPHSWERVDHD